MPAAATSALQARSKRWQVHVAIPCPAVLAWLLIDRYAVKFATTARANKLHVSDLAIRCCYPLDCTSNTLPALQLLHDGGSGAIH